MEVESQVGSIRTAAETSFIKSCYNASGAFLGIGILTLPYGLSEGGWLSLLLLLFIACLSFYTGILIKRCMLSHNSIRSYEDIAQRAFGKKGRILVCIIVNLGLYLVAVGLLIIEGDNLHKLFPNFMLKFGAFTIGGKPSFVIITMLAMLLLSIFSTDIGIVSYISAMGLFCIITVVVSLFCIGATTGIGFHGKSSRLVSIEGIPVSIGLYIACFGGHPVIPTVYTSMQDKRQFNKALLISFFVNIIIYVLTAVFGYLMYGSNVESQIILNLPQKEISSKVAIYTTLIIPITKYDLMVTPVANAILESGPLRDYSERKITQLLIRVSILITTTIVACVFPYFEILMGILGSIFVVSASLLLPCCCYLKISGGVALIRRYELICIIGITIFGCFAGVIGTYSSIVGIMHSM